MGTDELENHRPKSITRTLSETFFGGFRKRGREDDSDESRSNSFGASFGLGIGKNGDNSDEEHPTAKKQKIAPLTKEEIAKREEELKKFNTLEKEYDSLLKPEYRKWRPKGHKLNPPPEDRPVRIYADGVFDLFHLGHMRQLEQCKKALPNVELVVGIPNDKETHKRKGLTVLTDKQRYETVRHCKWVDEVVEDAPWILDMKFLKDHKIDYCAHDDLPYVADGYDDIYKPMKENGMFIATQRTEGISTSDIITKIIRDYDKYLMRNFDRGATRQELNVSWLKKNELDMKKNIQEFKNSWKQTNNNFQHMTKDLYVLVRESLINNSNNHRSIMSPIEKFALKFNANQRKMIKSAVANKQKKSLLTNIRDYWAGNNETEDSNEDDDSEEDMDTDVSKRSIRSSGKSTTNNTPRKKPQTPKKSETPKKIDLVSPKKLQLATNKKSAPSTPKKNLKKNTTKSPKKTPSRASEKSV